MHPSRRAFLRHLGEGLAATSAVQALSACRAHHDRAIEAAATDLDRFFEALDAVLG